MEDALALGQYTRHRLPDDWQRHGDTIGVDLIEEFHAGLLDRLWRPARVPLGRAFHGMRACPEPRCPLLPGRVVTGRCAADCALVFVDAMRRVFRRLFQAEIEGGAAGAGRRAAALSQAAVSRAIRDALQRHWVVDGLVANPDRAVGQAWVRALVPDDAARALVAKLLWLARTADDLSGGVPWDRLGAGVGLPAAQARETATQALCRLSEVRPDWVTVNIDRPLGGRLHARLGERPAEDDDEDATLAHLAHTLAADLQRRGLPHPAALLHAAQTVFGADALAVAVDSGRWAAYLAEA